MAGPPRHPHRAWPGAVASGCDTFLDVTLVVLATWTIVYHAALLLSLDVVTAAVLEVAALVATTLAWLRLRRPATTTGPQGLVPDGTAEPARSRRRRGDNGTQDHRWAVVAVAVAALSAVAMALDLPWFLVWTTWLVAAAAATWWAVGRFAAGAGAPTGLPLDDVDGGPPAPPGPRETLVAVGAAVAATLFALFSLRSNPDDLFYVNFSQWIAEHGSFPLRDTLFSDQVLPAVNWPPLASYDGLVGAVAHLTGTYAGTVVYVVVPPVAAFLAVVALWRLLRAWRVRHVPLALVAALVFLLFDGTESYATPGNLFVTRLWQGKVLVLCLLVPLLLVRLLEHVDRSSAAPRDVPPARTTVRLLVGGIAAVGCSTTAIFLVPLIALAGVAPLARRAPRSAVAGFAALAGYPLAAGIVTLALGGRSADDFGARRLYRFDPAWFGHQIFLTGLVAAVGVFAVLVGALLVPHPAARVTTGLLVLMTGVTFVPGFTHLSYRLTGLGPTLWRVSWGCTVAALVGLAASWVLVRLPFRRALVVATAAVVALGVLGAPVWAHDTNTTFAWPLHWQRGHDTREMAAKLIATSRPGDLILAPSGLAITLVVTDTDIRTVAPRGYAMRQFRRLPSFHITERRRLVNFVDNGDTWRRSAVRQALEVLDVDTACLPSEDVLRAEALRDDGYDLVLATSAYLCFRR